MRDDFYNLPRVFHASIEALNLDGPESIHVVSVEGWEIPFYFRPAPPGGFLNVGFQGGIERHRIRLPYFKRLRSSKKWAGAVLIISDPTITLSDDLRLGWYVGNDGFDLMPHLEKLIARVQAFTQPRDLMFLGSSGGGFPALKLSQKFPGSLAFVSNPSTEIPRFTPWRFKHFMDVCFPGRSSEEPEIAPRLTCLADYRMPAEHYVYYLNNPTDGWHMEHFAKPFAQRMGVPQEGGVSPDGRVRLVLDKHREGHGEPPPPVYEAHRQEAITFYLKAKYS